MAILNHDYYGKPNKCLAFFLRDSGEPAPHPEINNFKKKKMLFISGSGFIIH